MTTQTIDEAKLGAFMEHVLCDAAGLMASTLATLGDRLGLFKALGAEGPASSGELASAADVNERYAREWLRGMHAAGYLELDRESGRYSLPPEHAQVLATEGGPAFLGGAFQLSFGYLRTIERLAEAFPASTFVGYDKFDGQIQLARRAAEDAGVANRVSFELLDAEAGLPERFDAISAFDVVHDAVDPPALVGAIHRGIDPDGTFLVLEMNSADDPDENVGPLATLLYGVSIVYCMTTSLAHGGAGLGTCGLPPRRVEELCKQAGFTTVRRLDLQDPFNSLYVVNP